MVNYESPLGLVLLRSIHVTLIVLANAERTHDEIHTLFVTTWVESLAYYVSADKQTRTSDLMSCAQVSFFLCLFFYLFLIMFSFSFLSLLRYI